MPNDPTSNNKLDAAKLDAATRLLSEHPQILFAALFGSRARGDAKANSDWDIAVKWRPDTDWFLQLGEHERLRSQLAGILGVTMADLDLVDLKATSLALRAAVADEGVPLADTDGLGWIHFLQRTWRELEEHDWYLRTSLALPVMHGEVHPWERRHPPIKSRAGSGGSFPVCEAR